MDPEERAPDLFAQAQTRDDDEHRDRRAIETKPLSDGFLLLMHGTPAQAILFMTSRYARPTARRLSTFISSYSREATMPCAPASKALRVACSTTAGSSERLPGTSKPTPV